MKLATSVIADEPYHDEQIAPIIPNGSGHNERK